MFYLLLLNEQHEVELSRVKVQQELKDFCDGSPVEITNTYAEVWQGGMAQRREALYVVVTFDSQSKTLRMTPNQSVNVGEMWYLHIVNCDTHYEIRLKNKVKPTRR